MDGERERLSTISPYHWVAKTHFCKSVHCSARMCGAVSQTLVFVRWSEGCIVPPPPPAAAAPAPVPALIQYSWPDCAAVRLSLSD